MTTILPIERQHYEAMFELGKVAEPFPGPHYFDKFGLQMQDREGFTVWNEQGVLIGICSFSNFVPGYSVMVHMVFHPEHKSVSRRMLRVFFRFAFVDLNVPRVISFSIVGMTDEAGEFLRRLGFRQEGLFKEVHQCRVAHVTYDVKLWAMLKRECRWL